MYVCLNINGKLKWKTAVRGGIVADSPALSEDGKLYFGCFDGRLYALDTVNDREIWIFNTGDKIYTTPCIGQDGTVYIGSNNGKLYAVDGKDGGKLGEFYIAPFLQSSPAITLDSTIYLNARDGRVFCIPRELIR